MKSAIVELILIVWFSVTLVRHRLSNGWISTVTRFTQPNSERNGWPPRTTHFLSRSWCKSLIVGVKAPTSQTRWEKVRAWNLHRNTLFGSCQRHTWGLEELPGAQVWRNQLYLKANCNGLRHCDIKSWICQVILLHQNSLTSPGVSASGCQMIGSHGNDGYLWKLCHIGLSSWNSLAVEATKQV